MAGQEFPESFRDPLYASLDAGNEEKFGLPTGMLSAVRTEGERTNASRVSSAGARTPYQITPATRKAVLDQYGVDAYLSPGTASEVAGILLRDSMKRNDSDPEQAVREYHGGTNRDNWGKVNEAYWRRVGSGMRDTATRSMADTFGQWMAENPAAAPVANAGHQATPAPADMAQGFANWRSGGDQIPGSDPPPARQPVALGIPPTPAPAEPGLIDKAIGTGEAALTTATGATGGTLGMIGGTLKGLAEQILSGQFGTAQAADLVEKSAMQGAQALTYRPRTQSGQDQTEAVGQFLQQVLPAAVVAPSLAVPGAMAVANQAGRAGAAAVLDRAATAMPAVVRDRLGVPAAADAAVAAAPDVAQATTATAPAAAAMTPEELAATARKAVNGGIGSGKAEQVLAEQASPDPATISAARRLGIEEHLQHDHVTTSEAYRQVTAALKSSNPGSALSIAEREGLSRVSQRASELVDELGGTRDLSALDQGVKDNLKGTVDELSGHADALYEKLRDNIPSKAPAPADNVLEFIKQRADELGGAQNLTPLEKQIVAKLTPKEVKTVETVPGNPLMPGAQSATKRTTTALRQPTYTLLDDVRKDVGAAARMAGPFKDADTGLAKKLYELITADQGKIADGAGMSDVLAAAKAAVSQRKAIESDLASLFGRNLDRSLLRGGEGGLAGAVSRVAQGDTSALTRLLAAVPPEMRQSVVASGLGTVFKRATSGGRMDFTGYAKWYEGLRTNRQAYAATMVNLPLAARKQLAALYQVSKGVSESLNRRTGTGAINTIRAELLGKETLLDNLYALARRGAVGAAVGTVATPIAGPGVGAALASALTKVKPRSMAAVDELLASPEFAHLVRTTAGTKEQAAVVKRVAHSAPFLRMVRAVGNPRELANREKWLLGAMRPPAQPQQQDQRQSAAHH